jgi:hypothetical protein
MKQIITLLMLTILISTSCKKESEAALRLEGTTYKATYSQFGQTYTDIMEYPTESTGSITSYDGDMKVQHVFTYTYSLEEDVLSFVRDANGIPGTWQMLDGDHQIKTNSFTYIRQ